MKRTIKAMCLFGLVLVLLMAPAAPATAAELVTLNCLVSWVKGNANPDFFALDFVQRIQQEADKKFPGELKLVYKGGPEVVNTPDQITAVGKGMIDLLYTSGAFYVSKMPEMDIMNLSPLMPWEQKAAGLNEYLEKLHIEKTNTHYLATNGTGGQPFVFGFSKNVKNLNDMKGINIRGNPTTVQAIKALGANPIQMPLGDTYQAMERGVVQGHTMPVYGIRPSGLTGVTKSVLLPGFYNNHNCILINLDKWKKIPKHLQDFLTEQADIHTRHFAEFNMDTDKKEMEYLKQQGTQFNTLSQEEAVHFKKLTDEALMNVCLEKAPVETKKIMEYFAKKP